MGRAVPPSRLPTPDQASGPEREALTVILEEPSGNSLLSLPSPSSCAGGNVRPPGPLGAGGGGGAQAPGEGAEAPEGRRGGRPPGTLEDLLWACIALRPVPLRGGWCGSPLLRWGRPGLRAVAQGTWPLRGPRGGLGLEGQHGILSPSGATTWEPSGFCRSLGLPICRGRVPCACGQVMHTRAQLVRAWRSPYPGAAFCTPQPKEASWRCPQ